MDDASGASNSSESPSHQTIVITPSELQKMGFTSQLKNVIEIQTIKKEESNPTEMPDNSTEIKVDKNLQKSMKNKLCTLLNHTPLVMQVKNVDWMKPDKMDRNVLTAHLDTVKDNEEQNTKLKLKIVSDEKLNISASEIENMLSSGKVVMNVNTPKVKHEVEESEEASNDSNRNTDKEPKVETKASQSTSNDSKGDPGVLKKECLMRIQAKMYENLKKVLDEVDSLPVKDKASLSIKPVTISTDDGKASAKQNPVLKGAEKTKENKPCYMSAYRERKQSQDCLEPMKTTTSTVDDDMCDLYNDLEISTRKDIKDDCTEIIHTDNSNEVVRIKRKRGRPRKNPIITVPGSDIIQIRGISIQKTKIPKKRGRPPKKNIIPRSPYTESESESIESEEKIRINIVCDSPGKDESPKGQVDTPRRKKGSPRKITVSESVENPSVEQNHEPEPTEEIKPSNEKPQTLPRKRGRPRKIRNPEPIENNDSSVSKPELNNEESESVDKPEARVESGSPVKILKKRGRKTKLEKQALKKEMKETQMGKEEAAEESTEEYTQSRRSGRKRKVVDYTLLNGDDSDLEEPEIKYVKTDDTPEKVTEPENPSNENNKTSDDEYGSSNITEKKNTEDDDNEDVSADKEREQFKDDENAPEITLEVGSEEDTDENDTLTIELVKCGACEKVIEKDLWPEHKRKNHNDLTWISGEKPLNLEDTAIVEEILSAVLKEDGVLKCDICVMEIDSVQSYMNHKKNCKSITVETNLDLDKTLDSEDRLRKRKKSGTSSEILTSLFNNMNKHTRDENSEVTNENVTPQTTPVNLHKDETQCAVCLKVIQKNHWFRHKQTIHNNLAWRVGDTPLDLNNLDLVMKVLKAFCAKKKPLYCDICGLSRKSVLGFLSHKSQCQKSNEEIACMKISCNLCHRRLLPVSLSRHMTLSHPENTETVEKPEDDNERALAGKRKAANKAFALIQGIKEEDPDKIKKYIKGIRFRSVDEVITKFNEDIQNFNEASCVFENCSYTATEAEDLFQHLENCMQRCNDGYTCNFCLATFKFKKLINEHLNSSHPLDGKENLIIQNVYSDDEQFDDEDSDQDDKNNILNEEERQRTPFLKSPIKFLANTRKKLINICYPYACKWTLDFYKENCSVENVFPNLISQRNSWRNLETSEILNYLPKLKRSIDIAITNVNFVNDPNSSDHKWVNYKLFQSEIESNGDTTIFCGGPVNAMSWVPTPYNLPDADQILAVTVLQDPDKKYYSTRKYNDKGLIQFWNYGSLSNKIDPTVKPKLEFCIAHSYGVIWYLEWCPSGCYDVTETNELKKLGLLAVACSDSSVYIYTVFQPQQLKGKIFEVKPTFKLILENVSEVNLGEVFYHTTKISWSKVAGHSYVAVGFSNGMVGIFNLNTKSKLLRKVVEGVIVLKPTLSFKPHNEAVTALALHHLSNGNRWLMTGSLDRECKLWDLKNTTEPLSCMKKFIITDATWIIHWLCAIYTFDHASLVGSIPSALVPVRNFKGLMTTFLPSNSRTTSVSSNDWGNLFMQANDSGELICSFPDQLLYGFDIDKRKTVRKCRTVTSYSGYAMKTLTPDERQQREKHKLEKLKNQSGQNNSNITGSEPRTYKDISDSYGLIICDVNMDLKKNDPSRELDKLLHSLPFHSLSKPDVYPVQSINKVVLNPNRNSFLYYAYGYQIGLVRTSLLKFLND